MEKNQTFSHRNHQKWHNLSLFLNLVSIWQIDQKENWIKRSRDGDGERAPPVQTPLSRPLLGTHPLPWDSCPSTAVQWNPLYTDGIPLGSWEVRSGRSPGNQRIRPKFWLQTTLRNRKVPKQSAGTWPLFPPHPILRTCSFCKSLLCHQSRATWVLQHWVLSGPPRTRCHPLLPSYCISTLDFLHFLHLWLKYFLLRVSNRHIIS